MHKVRNVLICTVLRFSIDAQIYNFPHLYILLSLSLSPHFACVVHNTKRMIQSKYFSLLLYRAFLSAYCIYIHIHLYTICTGRKAFNFAHHSKGLCLLKLHTSQMRLSPFCDKINNGDSFIRLLYNSNGFQFAEEETMLLKFIVFSSINGCKIFSVQENFFVLLDNHLISPRTQTVQFRFIDIFEFINSSSHLLINSLIY